MPSTWSTSPQTLLGPAGRGGVNNSQRPSPPPLWCVSSGGRQGPTGPLHFPRAGTWFGRLCLLHTQRQQRVDPSKRAGTDDQSAAIELSVKGFPEPAQGNPIKARDGLEEREAGISMNINDFLFPLRGLNLCLSFLGVFCFSTPSHQTRTEALWCFLEGFDWRNQRLSAGACIQVLSLLLPFQRLCTQKHMSYF